MTFDHEKHPDVGSCTCEMCADACDRRPGWFLPGEVEAVAKHLDVPLAELFRKRLMIDYWMADRSMPDFDVLSPAAVGYEGRRAALFARRERCTFLVDGKCSIHEVKPAECRKTGHRGEVYLHKRSLHRDIASAWNNEEAQAMIRRLEEGED